MNTDETAESIARRTQDVQSDLARIWSEVLRIPDCRIDPDANFFALGGDSLLIARVADLVVSRFFPERPDDAPGIAEYFSYGTLRSFAGRLVPALACQNRVRVQPLADDSSVAIIGMSCRFPDASDCEAFWRNLHDGVQSVRIFTDDELLEAGVSAEELQNPCYVKAGVLLEGVRLFDAEYFGMTAREAVLTSPEQRLLIECAEEALQDGGYGDRGCAASVVGVFAGTGISTYLLELFAAEPCNLESSQGMALFAANTCAASRIAYLLDLVGPALTVDTACSSSLVAVHEACQSILRGECVMALAGGATVRRFGARGYVAEPGGIFSSDGHCRPFDARANGTVSSSGAGMVLLKRLSDAIADGDVIHAVIRGTAVNNDGRAKAGFTAPSAAGQAAVIRAAMAAARVEPRTIQYVETHGTATSLGDAIELSALREVFASDAPHGRGPALGALKANLGHMEAAAGIAGLIKTALALKHRQIPPAVHFERWAAAPGGLSFELSSRLTEWPGSSIPRRAGVSSFGVGGTNAHAVLEEAPLIATATTTRPFELVVISARTETALRESCRRLAAHLNADSPGELAKIAFTMQVGRKRFDHRAYVVASDTAEATRLLESAAATARSAAHRTGNIPIAFMFPDQLRSLRCKFQKLYDAEPRFRQHLDECNRLLMPLLGQDLLQILRAPAHEIEQRDWIAPALFAVEYSLGQLWLSWGVTPSMVTGHGVGACVAACIAGLFTLGDALELVVARSRAGDLTEELARTLRAVEGDEVRIPFVSADQLLPGFAGILIEVAPGNTLSVPVQAEPDSQAFTVVRSGADEDAGCDEHRALLHALGRVWELGGAVDWRSFNASRSVRRVPLPAYPFERREHWITRSPDAPRTTSPRRERLGLSDWFNAAVWEQKPALQGSGLLRASARPDLECCLMLGAWSELESAVSQQPALTGMRMVCVSIADYYSREGNRLTIDRRDASSMARLLETLEHEGTPVSSIVHCAEAVGVRDVSARPDDASLESLHSLIDLSTVRPSVRRRLARLIVVTRGAHAVVDESGSSPSRAILAAVTQVLAREFPETCCRTIDIAPGVAPTERAEQQALNMLVAEIFADCTDPLVAIRGARRWVRAYRRVPLAGAAEERSLLRRGGAYLVTGGMGGIGWTLARFLARQLRARLILTSRSSFPPRSEWSRLMQTGATEESVLERIREIQSLEAGGACLLVMSADVSSSADMNRVLARANQELGRLDGVIHAAGVAGPAAGRNLSIRESFRDVLAPKVLGTWTTLDACRSQQLDFFACCSSVAAVMAPEGWHGYCAGNAFQDAFCEAHEGRTGTRFISIGWDSWKDVGFAARAGSSSQLDPGQSAGVASAISPEEGVQVFQRALSNPAARWIISTRDLNERLGNEGGVRAALRATAPHAPMAASARGGTASPAAIQAELTLIWAKLLGVESVHAADDFFSCGGDSLSVVELRTEIEVHFGRSPPLRELLASPTLGAMAQLLQGAA